MIGVINTFKILQHSGELSYKLYKVNSIYLAWIYWDKAWLRSPLFCLNNASHCTLLNSVSSTNIATSAWLIAGLLATAATILLEAPLDDDDDDDEDDDDDDEE